MYILGISAYYHDSAACLLENGEVIAAAQEERFTRKKHDSNFPALAIDYCLKEAGINLNDISYITFYDKPFVKFERLLETYLTYAPKGYRSFIMAMPVWLKEKLFLKSVIKKELVKLSKTGKKNLPKLLFSEHHQSHAASAFFVSPYEKAAVICLDGVGEWATTTVWLGDRNKLELKWEIDFPHSLGLLYSAFTYYTGFKVNSGEYKLMGLAPYGEPKYKDLIYKYLIDVKPDGTFHVNMKYFNYATGLTMTNSHFDKLFGGPARKPESELTQKEMDIARSIQVVTEEIILKLATAVQKELNVDSLCLAGGVALNCVANGRLLREGPFKNIWIQPAAGDAGGAMGSALATHYQYLGNERTRFEDATKGSYLGPKYSNEEISTFLKSKNIPFDFIQDDAILLEKLATILEAGNVIGWVQGRMEFGPRALGARSILGDPRNTKMQSIMNLKVKYRESFRPFAPAVLAEDVDKYFEFKGDSPYMLMVAPVKHEHRINMTDEQQGYFGIKKLNVARSTLPAITHIDYSARVQTVTEKTNPRFYKLIKAFKNKTGCSVLVNTSFNVRGEPIVTSPEDSYRCFMRTEMDYLVLENCLIDKTKQPKAEQNESWKNEFVLD
ncbi:MAG: carbamoyltransferase [Bacteriovoracaceae bacterium]